MFKLKNFLVFNTFNDVYNNLYKLMSIKFKKSLKKYFYNKLYFIDKSHYITYLTDFLLFKVSNISSSTIDTVQKLNLNLFIYIPIKYLNKLKGTCTVFYCLLGEIPIYDKYKNLVINGLKKTFISKLNINNNNLFFNSYIKGSVEVYYAKLILSSNLFINIVLENNSCFIIVNSIKYFLADFIYMLGYSLKDAFILSRYSNYYNYKKLFLNKFNFKKKDEIYTTQLLELYYFLSKYYTSINEDKKSYIFNLYKIKSTLGTMNNNINSLFYYDFISIIDILLDLKYKKRNLKEIYNYEYRSVYSISDYYIDYFEKFLKTHKNFLKNTLFDVINKYETNKCTNIFIKPNIYFKLKEYLTINPLIQYIEQINSISEVSHKNRVSNYNLKTTQNLSIRDVHLNQLGSLCIIDTTEGINCGLVISFTKHIKLHNNSILFPYSFILDFKSKQQIKYINFSSQETYFILFNVFYLRKNNLIDCSSLKLNKENFKISTSINYKTLYIKPQNLFSFSENLIPFIFYNEPTRTLMGSKMQLQSVPTLKTSKSYITTGYEKDIILNSNNIVYAYQEGIVVHATSYKIILRDILNRKIIYYLDKYKKTNQNTIIHQKPNVWVGERVFSGQILANNQDIIDSEFSIGNNLIISYGNFYGYNFEDAIVLNKRVIYKQLFTSLHFNVYETTYNKLNNGYIEIPTLYIPKKSFIQKRNLDYFGLIKEGSKVLNNDIILSKISIKVLNIKFFSLTYLLNLLFGDQLREVKDLSLSIPYGNSGRVVKIEVFSNLNNSFKSNCYLKVRVYVCKQRLLSVGDKLCGRYGNKGVIAYIASNNDLPFSISGIIPDIITDSIGIPSRLNIGQLFESLFGLNCFINNKRLCITNKFNLPKVYYKTLIYDTLKKTQTKYNLNTLYNSYIPGKINMKDGRTGFKFNEPSFLGVSKYSKLIHMVKDKVHYRVIGPYTELMQQPVKGRSNLGGQRFGEMEIWALEAYGASYNLRELLNYKSDDLNARKSLQENLLENKPLTNISTPEAFKLVLRELNGMLLNVEAFSSIDQLNGNTVSININY